MNRKFVPDTFEVPKVLERANFRLRMLTVNDVVKDYDAVMPSVKHLKGVFGKDNTWPQDNLTFEQDLIDLGWHQKEFQTRSSFAYTVMNPDESQCLGCVYIMPSSNPKYDAVVFCWVRKSELENGLDETLYSTIKNWIKSKWQFKNVGYPGRETSWEDYYKEQ